MTKIEKIVLATITVLIMFLALDLIFLSNAIKNFDFDQWIKEHPIVINQITQATKAQCCNGCNKK